MLIGKFYNRLEKNNRVTLPKSFREVAKSWIVTRGLDGCLFLFETDSFQEKLNPLVSRSLTKKANRDLIRLLTSEAQTLQCDKTGRIHLPSYLIEFAKLKKEVVIVGSYDHIEIWSQDHYHHYLDTLEPLAETIAEQTDVNSSLT